MSHTKPDRDAEVRKLHAEGRSHAYIADRYSITISRVSQIIHGRDRSKERKNKDHPIVISQDRAPHGIKPRLKRTSQGHWSCEHVGIVRTAMTYQAAYQRWLTAILAVSACQQRMGISDGLVPVSVPHAVEKPAATAFTPPAEVKPVGRRQAVVKGKSTTGLITPPKWAEPPKEPAPAYDGPVTVLPGTAPRRELRLSTTLQLNGARAAAVQPRMVSIAGSTAREDAA